MTKMKTVTVRYPKFTARYYGAAYIDLFVNDWTAYDCINVYDYEQSRPTIDFTEDAVRAVIEDLIAQGDDRVCNVEQYLW